MHVSGRYRDSAAECLLAAEEASQPHRRKLHLSMAISWLSLARQYEAIEHLFQGTGEAALIKGARYLNGKWVYRIHIRHEQSVWHPLLKMPDHSRLGFRN